MPKRYKPSDKLPMSGCDIILKIKGRNVWEFGTYDPESDNSLFWHIAPIGSLYSSDEIDWWLDPMEED